MIQETIATGRDVNAAIDNGCRELGINREEDLFDFEIIAREKKGFLGLKTYPAKVRVFREVPDPKPLPLSPRLPPRKRSPGRSVPRRLLRPSPGRPGSRRSSPSGSPVPPGRRSPGRTAPARRAVPVPSALFRKPPNPVSPPPPEWRWSPPTTFGSGWSAAPPM